MKSSVRAFVFLMIAMLLPTAAPAAAQDRELFDEIASDMESIRDLVLLEPLEITFMTRDEFQEQAAGDFLSEEDAAAMADSQRVLVAFGLLAPDEDPVALYSGMIGEGVAGFYDPFSNQMVVITASGDEELTALNQVTFAHETVHALQDQHFDLLSLSEARMEGTNDEALAVTALIEGDASVAEADYLLSERALALDYLIELYAMESSGVWEDTPPILLLPLTFPYREGQVFVQALYDEGGWDLVDAAYEAPPNSTEQILHPQKYLDREEPVLIDVPDVAADLSDEWRIVEQNTWGEYAISIILEGAELSEAQLEAAHSGWGGDSYLALTDEEDTAVAWATEWDSEADAEQFLRALVVRESGRLDVGVARDGDVVTLATDDVVVQIVQHGTSVTYLQGPDAATVSTMSETIEG